jgi:hypothetical protein
LGRALATFAAALAIKYTYGNSLIQTPLPLLAAVIGLSGVLFLLLGIIAEVHRTAETTAPETSRLHIDAAAVLQ